VSTGFKAIETRYRGFRFRSRLEARWAVFMDTVGIRWTYEPEGFELGKDGRYLPDFWLPDLRMWMEIKPEQPAFNGDAWKKAEGLLAFQGWPVCIFFGVPEMRRGGVGIRNDMADSSGGLGYDDPVYWVRCRSCGLFTVALGDARHLVVKQDWGSWRDSPCCEEEVNWDASDLLLREAVDAARSARFEFGESGTR
jgi:hypothetical protein